MTPFRSTALLAPVLALALTACGGDGGDTGATDDGAAASGSVSVEATDLAFDPTQLTAAAGEVEVELVNAGSAEHDFVVEETGDTDVVHAMPGETNTGTIELEAGSYTFYCSVPGHREAGMEGTLEVQ